MKSLCKLPDRNDSADKRQAWIDDRHQALDRPRIRQRGMADLNFLPLAGWDRWQLRLLAVVDQHAIQLSVVEAVIQQIQLPARQRGIDDQQVEGLATVFHQAQQLFEMLHWRYPKVIELVEPALDSPPIEVLLVSDQDA